MVTATLAEPLDAGASVSLQVVASVDATDPPVASETLTNTVSVDFRDSIGNAFAPVTATDEDITGTGVIGDLVWLDLDADGIVDPGEAGIAGVDVSLESPGPDGLSGTDDDISLTTTTGADGTYRFDGLPSGSYTVTVDEADAPDDTSLVSGSNPTVVELALGQVFLDADFGFRGPGSIGDLVWIDTRTQIQTRAPAPAQVPARRSTTTSRPRRPLLRAASIPAVSSPPEPTPPS